MTKAYVPARVQLYAQMFKHIQPASVAIAQGMLESGRFKSALYKDHNNLFGHKWSKRSICSGKVEMLTTEWTGGGKNKKPHKVKQVFATYDGLKQCFQDHERILSLGYYKAARQYINSPHAYARRLKSYATDPQYCDKLIDLIDRYNLTKYDTKVNKPDKEVGDMVEGAAKEMFKWSPIYWIGKLLGGRKHASYLTALIAVIFNHATGNPDPNLDAVIVAVAGIYQAIEAFVDAARAFARALESKKNPPQLTEGSS